MATQPDVGSVSGIFCTGDVIIIVMCTHFPNGARLYSPLLQQQCSLRGIFKITDINYVKPDNWHLL
jgi:hypothetical protein